MKQTGSSADFYLEFTALANRSEGLTSKALIDCFVSGLHEDIRRDVKSMMPHTLFKVVSLAKLFEEKYPHIKKPKQHNTFTKNTYSSSYTTPQEKTQKIDTAPNP